MIMNEIIPAILPRSLSELEQGLTGLEPFSPWAHLDVIDGHFAPVVTWQEPSDLETIAGQIKIEVHLMVTAPEKIIAAWRSVVDRLIIQLEATNILGEIIESFVGQPTKLGVALKLETPLSALDQYLDRLDFVHLMSIAKIGHQGEPFAQIVLEKVRNLRLRSPQLKIGIDGGLNPLTLPLALAAGANHFVVGSALWKDHDPHQTFTELKKLL